MPGSSLRRRRMTTMFTSHPRHRSRLLTRSGYRIHNRKASDQNRPERLSTELRVNLMAARNQGLNLISWSGWALLGLGTLIVVTLFLMVMARVRMESLFRLAR